LNELFKISILPMLLILKAIIWLVSKGWPVFAGLIFAGLICNMFHLHGEGVFLAVIVIIIIFFALKNWRSISSITKGR